MKHTKKQTKALWASAEHWLENWSYPQGAEIYTTHCPCCKEFLKPQAPSWEECGECPIQQWSEQPLCERTPWPEAAASFSGIEASREHLEFPAVRESVCQAFEAEYRFLVCLALGEDPNTED